MTASRQPPKPRSARKWCALLVICGLFVQWAAGLGASVESGLDDRPGPCAMDAGRPFCGVTQPAEEQVTVASIFYQPAVLPQAAPALAEKTISDFPPPPHGCASIARVILRRPPRA